MHKVGYMSTSQQCSRQRQQPCASPTRSQFDHGRQRLPAPCGLTLQKNITGCWCSSALVMIFSTAATSGLDVSRMISYSISKPPSLTALQYESYARRMHTRTCLRTETR